jgi:hypothetical protein
MEGYCENPFCQNQSVKQVPVFIDGVLGQVRSLCSICEETYTWGVQYGQCASPGLRIEAPPEEKGDEPLFRVVYIIDVNAGDVREAAEYTHRIMTDPTSLRPVLHVIDSKGNNTEIDLSKDDAGCDDNEETANYEAAARYLADEGDKVFTGPMKGGLWNGRCLDACIMSEKQGDKVAYESLIKFGDQYITSLSEEHHRQWQQIKDHAASLLKSHKNDTKPKMGGSHA